MFLPLLCLCLTSVGVANAADDVWLNRMAKKGLVVEGMTPSQVTKARGGPGKRVARDVWQYTAGDCRVVYEVESSASGYEVQHPTPSNCFIERIEFSQGRVSSVTGH